MRLRYGTLHLISPRGQEPASISIESTWSPPSSSYYRSKKTEGGSGGDRLKKGQNRDGSERSRFFPNFATRRGRLKPDQKEEWEREKEKRRAEEDGKVGGKDEINSSVYGALKVAGISLTTWQTATVVAFLAGGLKCIDGRSLARSRMCARVRNE